MQFEILYPMHVLASGKSKFRSNSLNLAFGSDLDWTDQIQSPIYLDRRWYLNW